MPINFTGSATSRIIVSDDSDTWVTLAADTITASGTGFEIGNYRYLTYIMGGTISATADGISAGSDSSGNIINILETGTVMGNQNGISFAGTGHQLLNQGTVTGTDGIGIVLAEDGYSDTAITNTGTINGGTVGVVLGYLPGGRGGSINNTGIITGGDAGVRIGSDDVSVVNTGTITGDIGLEVISRLQGAPVHDVNVVQNAGLIEGTTGTAISGGLGDDIITNTGTIIGDVDLQDGADEYTATRGTTDGDVYGGNGDDILSGSATRDYLFGDDDNDILYGKRGGDTLFGGKHNDIIKGGVGADLISGGKNNDQLFGGSQDDVLEGDSGKDMLYGGNGADRLNGGTGNDQLTGGGGGDVFIFDGSVGTDKIYDFENTIDQIDLSAYGVTFATVDAALDLSGSNAILDIGELGGSGKLIILGAAGQIDASDFIL